MLATLLFVACGDDDTAKLSNRLDKALETYAEIVYASYEDSYDAAAELQIAIDNFVANPTAAGLQACKDKWLAARIPYGQTEAYRFYGGPIDDDDGPEGLINAWPMDENFIDYVEGNPNAGLINDPVTYPVISKQVLQDLNEAISETSIFTGYHAIEFLLWGQDLDPSGPGSRPYTDYLTDGSGTAANQARRGEYLRVVADLLLDHLAEVRDEWATNGAYRATFLATDQKTALGYLFTSLGEMSKGELSGERMFVAVDSKDQENEHSCFADNTITDIKMNFLGLKNVYYGFYKRTNGSTISGESIAAISAAEAKDLAAKVDEAFDAVNAKINAIPAPFDNAILNSETAVLDAVEALKDLSDHLSDVGFELGAEF